MIRAGRLLDGVATRAARGVRAWGVRRERADWPEPWNVVAGAVLLGSLAWFAFTTRIPNVERLPAEVIFGFLGLYVYSAGFLSGMRTGKAGSGGWAGAACGLAFGAAVCGTMYRTAVHEGVSESVRAGSLDQVAVAVTGLVFFIVMGALWSP